MKLYINIFQLKNKSNMANTTKSYNGNRRVDKAWNKTKNSTSHQCLHCTTQLAKILRMSSHPEGRTLVQNVQDHFFRPYQSSCFDCQISCTATWQCFVMNLVCGKLKYAEPPFRSSVNLTRELWENKRLSFKYQSNSKKKFLNHSLSSWTLVSFSLVF